MEYLGWRDFSDEQFQEAFIFINNARTINMTEEIMNKTILIKRTNSIKLPDAIIAATCLTKNLTLITSNTHDFKKIDSLEIFDPFVM